MIRSLMRKQIYKIALIPADGIGLEVVPAAARVLESVGGGTGGKYQFTTLDSGFELFQRTGSALPPATLAHLQSPDFCDGAIFGAVSSPSHKVKGYSSPIVAMRKHLDLYANVRPVSAPLSDIDMLIIRENTECLYVKQESETVDEVSGLRVATAQRKISEYASRRIARLALEYCLKRHATRLLHAEDPAQAKKPKLTIVHKANVMSVTDGLFRECCLSEASNPKYADVIVEEQLVDSMVYKLFRDPKPFDVVVAPNLYGDIISDAAAALVGSLGMVPGANVGDHFVIGEPVHGSAPDIAGQGMANPIACIRSAALLLEYLNETGDAAKVYRAVDDFVKREEALGSQGGMTADMGGRGSTDSVTSGIIDLLN